MVADGGVRVAGEDCVKWADLVSYVAQQQQGPDRELLEMAAAIDRHEAWHRRHLEEQLRATVARGPATWAILLNTLTALSAVAAVIIAVVALR